MASSGSILTRQPVKGVYGALFAISTLIRLPFYALYFAIPSNRPRPQWSFKAAIFTYITRVVFEFQARIEAKTATSLEPGTDKDNFQPVAPAPKDLMRGPLANTPITPMKLGGLWLPRRYERSDDSRILLHFHGGAFVVLTPRAYFAQCGPRTLCSELPASAAFSVQYRLASKTGGTFPAQLQDAVSAYRYLLKEQNISPSRIVLSGDSSGGNIVLALIRYISQYPDILPRPLAALLSSPWLDLTEAGTLVNNTSDYLSTDFLRWGAKRFVPPGIDPQSEYISPLYHPFATNVPIWIQVGTAEFFYPDVIDYVAKMRLIQGNKIGLFEQAEAMHSIFAIGDSVDMGETARAGARSAKEFLDGLAVPESGG